MSETREVAIKRLRMRSMRRGIKEMDLILSDFAERNLPGMSEQDLVLYDRLLQENDHDIYGWILGTVSVPPGFADLMVRITAGAAGIVGPRKI